MICNRLVCGINDENTQRLLLAEKDLTYAKALEIAVSQEAAAQNVQTLCGMRGRGGMSTTPGGPPMESINAVKSGKQPARQSSANDQSPSKDSLVFKPGVGMLKEYKAHIFIDPSVPPKFCKASSLPYAMKPLVEAQLDKLVQEGILSPIEHSEWAAPIVPVMKADCQSVRICGDFKQTVNKASPLDKYPIPKIEDLFSQLAGGQKFTKLDMSQVYQQICLDDESKKYVVINTSKGLLQYNRLPFGISSAPGIF